MMKDNSIRLKAETVNAQSQIGKLGFVPTRDARHSEGRMYPSNGPTRPRDSLESGARPDDEMGKPGGESPATRMRALAQRNEELEAMVHVAAHELRSPLVNIQGFSRELARACRQLRLRSVRNGNINAAGAEWDEIGEAVGYIQAGTEKMDSLLDGLLQYCRLGRFVPQKERVGMKALLEGIARTMRYQVRQAGAQLQIGRLPDCLGNPLQISQVFSNLLDNAVKYLDPKRAGRITVAGRVHSGFSIYSVRDNGIGIAPEHQSSCFEMFHRLDPARNPGEGLGLAIARRILECHGGRIEVSSNPGAGAAFFVYLPASRQAK
jgi:chemotaxis family two-component system sensor kinase Cph1